MTDTATMNYTQFILPPSVVTKLDLSRMVREVEQVDSELTTASARKKAGAPEPPMPTLSQQLTDFLMQNKLVIGASNQRTALLRELRLMKDRAPVIHMTFAVTADRESLEELATWLRSSISGQALIAVGLQPALIAGVYMRTPNSVHDMSLRGILEGRHDVLIKELETLRGRG